MKIATGAAMSTLRPIVNRALGRFGLRLVTVEKARESAVSDQSWAPQLELIRHDLLMPKFLYASPMDYSTESYPPRFDAPIYIPGVALPIPPANVRPGYSPDNDALYLEWGRTDHDRLVDIVQKHRGLQPGMTILDWGCSSGRVLRHFLAEHESLGWQLLGVDVQAYLVEWMRRHFPSEIEVLASSILPHLPYQDSSIDVIYGISVFTHTKYLWDFWLAEFRRVLRPGGLVIQTVQCETAWKFYHEHRDLDWVRNAHPSKMLETPELEDDYFLYGDAFVSQNFFRESVIKTYWGRIMEVVDFLPPQPGQYQNWIVLRNSNRAS